MKWFTSDLHLGHVLFPSRSAFKTLAHWETEIVSTINRCVNKSDTLYILGDLCLKNVARWRSKIKGQVFLIMGNHDPSVEKCREAFGRSQVRDTMTIKFGGTECFLSHYAHAFWPGSHYGTYHLYGHTHGQRETTLDDWMPARRSLDVCPENVYKLIGRWGPITEEEILGVLSQRQGHDPVQWYRDRTGSYDKQITEAETIRGLP